MERRNPEEFFKGKLEGPNRFFRRRTKEFKREMAGELPLGIDLDSRIKGKLYIASKERSTHMHILGSTGEGKSKFMEEMIREDILKDRGLCLIDPHGRLYDDVVKFCSQRNLTEKVLLFDPSEDEYVIGFNPVKREARDIGFQISGIVQAVLKAWNQEDTDETPRLGRWLGHTAYALAEKNLTLVEVEHFINLADGTLREIITSDIENEFVRQEWQMFNKLKQREQLQLVESLQNRMVKFLQIRRMRQILGQRDHTLDFKKIMDEGYILLVNLSLGKTILEEHARMLGTLLVNEFYSTATQREEGAKPFYFYIDEFGQFVTRDIAKALDQCRKFGLHLILAHQHLGQLKKEDPWVYNSVMTNTKTKVVFGGLTPEDARIMVETMFMGEFNPDEIKLILKQTKFRPVETTRNIFGHGEAKGEARGGGLSEMAGTTRIPLPCFFPDEKITYTEGMTNVETSGSSKSEIEQESEVPWYEYDEFQEVSSVQFRPLEEQIYRAMAVMVNQPTQYALVKIGKSPVKAVKTLTIKDTGVKEEEMLQFKEKVFKSHDCFSRINEVDKEIRKRRESLEKRIETQRKEPKKFGTSAPIHLPKNKKTKL